MKLTIFLIPALCFALDNAHTYVNTSGSGQSNRPMQAHITPRRGEIPNYPAAYANGLATGSQATVTSVWDDGSVKTADIRWHSTYTVGQTQKVDFRNAASPCTQATPTACTNAGLDTSGITAFASSAWDATMEVTPPQGTMVTKSARTMFLAGKWQYLIRGPVATQILISDFKTTANRFGWSRKHILALQQPMYAGDTSTTVADTSVLTGRTKPVKMMIDSEVVLICHWVGTTIYFGNSNGSSSACQNVNGRGVDATTAGVHYATPYGRYFFEDRTLRLASTIGNYDTLIPVNDASGISSVKVLEMGQERIRVCNKSGNSLYVGTGSWGCPQDFRGRFWEGTTNYYESWAPLQPIADYSSSTDEWVDAASGMKPLNPAFVVTFWPATGQYSVEFFIFNTSMDTVMDQEYTAVFKVQGTTVYTTPDRVRHIARTFLKFPNGAEVGKFTSTIADQAYWNTATPIKLAVDLNLDYRFSAGTLPFGSEVKATQTLIDTAFSVNTGHNYGTNYGWDNGSKCVEESPSSIGNLVYRNAGPIHKSMSDAGGRLDIGLHPHWFLAGITMMGSNLTNADRWMELIYGTANCGSLIPVFLMETDSSKYFCNSGAWTTQPNNKSCTVANQSTTAEGLWASIDARPNLVYTGGQDEASVPAGNTTLNYWQVGDGMAHFPDVAFIPYMLSGSWYHRMIAQGVAHFTLLSDANYAGQPGNLDIWDQPRFRMGSWGLKSPKNGARNMAWGMRNLFYGIWASVDGTPTKEYLDHKARTIIESREGMYNITDGSFYEACTGASDFESPWCYGRMRLGFNSPTGIIFDLALPGGYPYFDIYPNSWVSANYSFSAFSGFMHGYYMVTLPYADDLGFTYARPLAKKHLSAFVNWMTHPSINPYTIAEYRLPSAVCRPEGVAQTPDCGSQNNNTRGIQIWPTDWANVQKSWTEPAYSRGDFYNDCDLTSGYARIMGGVAAYMVNYAQGDYYTGNRAHQWLRANTKCKIGEETNPMWLFAPRTEKQLINLTVTEVTPTTASFSFVKPASAAVCTYQLSPTSSLTTSDINIPLNGNLAVSFTIAGLPGATTQAVRVTCGRAQDTITFTTR